ncbi:MAG: phage tail protein [Oscillospiraceae bacterium]|nr:phage tail protein [Oscillospiraceae bacterium]
MLNHGINTYKDDSGYVTVKSAACGIPIFFGAWPCHTAKGFMGKPQLVNGFAEAKELGGYSDEWRTENGDPKWTLCQAMYSHFRLFGVSPAIFYNVFDPAKHKTDVPAADVNVVDHTVVLPPEAFDNDKLVVKTTGEGGAALAKGTDYDVFYTATDCRIELIKGGSEYNATTLNIAYEKANPEAITAEDIEAAVEKVEMCRSTVGIVPDLLCAPGWSSNPVVAAVMDAKAENIEGLYKAKAVVDLDTSAEGANTVEKVKAYKDENGYTSENMIVCWPMVKKGGYLFDLSTIVCGLIASLDSDNGNCPFESPSNKSIDISGAVLKDGTEISLSYPQADTISYADGVVTVIHHDEWTLWGNYTGCWPELQDVAKHFICTNRTQDWICNTFVNLYRKYTDRPLTRILIDAIVNHFNIWLNGLTAEGKLCGGEIQYIGDNNPDRDLLKGKFRLDTKAASPVPAEQINMHIEYSVDMLTEALSA